ncbi:MAG: tail fiber domain-containing protein, partial [Cetobacterium sp.]
YTRIDSGARHAGVVAQEVQEVLPEVITKTVNPDGEETLGVAYGNMVSLLIEGIKELRAEVEKLKAERVV